MPQPSRRTGAEAQHIAGRLLQSEEQQRHRDRQGARPPPASAHLARVNKPVAQKSTEKQAGHAGQAVDQHHGVAGLATVTSVIAHQKSSRKPPMVYMLKLCSAPEAMIQRIVGVDSTSQ